MSGLPGPRGRRAGEQFRDDRCDVESPVEGHVVAGCGGGESTEEPCDRVQCRRQLRFESFEGGQYRAGVIDFGRQLRSGASEDTFGFPGECGRLVHERGDLFTLGQQ